MLTISLFYIFVIAIEIFLFYSPLYLLTYKVFSVDRKIGDVKLSVLLLTVSITLSIFFFNQIGGILYFFFFTNFN